MGDHCHIERLKEAVCFGTAIIKSRERREAKENATSVRYANKYTKRVEFVET